MSIVLVLAFVGSVVVALQRHHRHAPRVGANSPPSVHGSDSSIERTGLDHDWERVAHDLDASSTT